MSYPFIPLTPTTSTTPVVPATPISINTALSLQESIHECRRRRRSSRFQEGSEHASDQPAITDSYLISVLNEMDDYEKTRGSLAFDHPHKHHKSETNNWSVESFGTSLTGSTCDTRKETDSTLTWNKRNFGSVQSDSRASHYSNVDTGDGQKNFHETWHGVRKVLLGKLRDITSHKSKRSSKAYTGPHT